MVRTFFSINRVKRIHFGQNRPKMLLKRPVYSQTVYVIFFWPYRVQYHGLFMLWCQRMPKIYITVVFRPFFSMRRVKKCHFDRFLQNYGLLGDWTRLKPLFSQMAFAKDDLVQFWAQTDHQKCLYLTVISQFDITPKNSQLLWVGCFKKMAFVWLCKL